MSLSTLVAVRYLWLRVILSNVGGREKLSNASNGVEFGFQYETFEVQLSTHRHYDISW